MRPIALIGFMAAGKSTVGKALAAELMLPFVDTDKEVTRLEGKTPGEIIRERGERLFRRSEHQALAGLLETVPAFVCATGGGIVTYEPSRLLLAERFQVILLRIQAPTALSRIQQDKADRPLSDSDHPLRHIQDLLEYRNPMYEKTADFTVDADGLGPSEIVSQIKNFMQSCS